MIKKSKDFFAGLFFIVFAIIFFIYSFKIKAMAKTSIGPEFLPRIICILIALLGLAMTISSVVNGNKSAEDKNEGEPKENKFMVLATFILLALYVFLLKEIGFIITSIFYLMIQITILIPDRSKKNLIITGVISTTIPIVTYFLFVNVFNLLLPAGVLG